MPSNYRYQFLEQLKAALSDALNAEKQISGTAASVDPNIAGKAIRQAGATDLGYLAVANPLQMPDLQAPTQIVNIPTVSQQYQQRVGPSALEQRVYPGEYMPGGVIRTSTNSPIQQQTISKADWLLGRASNPVQIAGLLPTRASVMSGQASEPVTRNNPADRIIEALGERLGINPYAPASQRIYQNPLQRSIFNQLRFTSPETATGNYNEGYRFNPENRSNYNSEYDNKLAKYEVQARDTRYQNAATGVQDSTPAKRVAVEVLSPTLQPQQVARVGQPITIDVQAETIPDQNFVRTGGSPTEYYGPTRSVTPDTVNAAAPTAGNRFLPSTNNSQGYEFAGSQDLPSAGEITRKNFLEQALAERSRPSSIVSVNSSDRIPVSEARPYYTSESITDPRLSANPIDLNQIDMSRLGNSSARSVDPATVAISKTSAPANLSSAANDFLGTTETSRVVADVLGAEPASRSRLAGGLMGQTIDVEARPVVETSTTDKVRSILSQLEGRASGATSRMDAAVDSILNKIALERPAISFEVGNQVRTSPAQLPPSSRPVRPVEGATGRYSAVSGYEQVPEITRNTYNQMAEYRPERSRVSGGGRWAKLAGLGAGLAGGAGLVLTAPNEGEFERSMEDKQRNIARLTTALNEFATRGSDVSSAQVGFHTVPVARGSRQGIEYVGQGTAEDAKKSLLREALAYIGGTNSIQAPAYYGAP